MPEIKLTKRLTCLKPSEEQIFTEAIMEAYLRGKTDAEKWIPVTERLPEENGSYLVAAERGGVFITHYWADGQRFSSRGGRTVITHWKERPLPPKKEE